MDHYSEIQIFVAVAEENGLAAAARRLDLSAPTITRAIASLEQRIAIRLLDRSTRGVSLTDAGTRYVADCKRIINAVQEAEASAAGAHATPGGKITVSSPLVFGQNILTPILLDYLDEHADVSARAIFMDRFPNLHDEGIDIALLMGDLPDSSLIALKVGTIRRVVCASPDYLTKHGVPQHPSELMRHQLVASSADAHSPEWRFRDDNEIVKMPISPRLTTSTNTSAVRAALAGAGLTRVMSYQLVNFIRSGQLQLVLESYELEAIPVHVVYREGRRAAARVRSFVDYAVKRLREATY